MILKKFLALLLILILSIPGISVANDSQTATEAGSHAITLSSGSATYSNVTVTKTGDMPGKSDDYDWKGTNAAIHASGGGTLTIKGSSTTITSDATYGNAVFSYGGNLSGSNSGDETTINISDATIKTSKNNSGGIIVTGGGMITAENLTITTSGGSSAAIRSDKGGGTISVTGGTYTTLGTGSPAIYSTANITASNATLKSNASQGVVIEGGNSVTLNSRTAINANHSTLNEQDTTRQAILIYQSMSGDASDGKASFSMTDGSITNTNGDIFCVTNTTCTIKLSNVTITNNDSSGNFLRAAAQRWGTSDSNGGNVTLDATNQTISGNILVDALSSLTMTLSGTSAFTGTINSANAGTVNLTVESGSTLTLTGNSYVKSLTNNGTVNTGSYTLYVNGTAYNNENSTTNDTTNENDTNNTTETSDGDSKTSTTSGMHAISVTDGSSKIFTNATVTKTGDSTDSDSVEYDGTNSAIYASNGSTLTLSGNSTTITSNAAYGHAVFSYGKSSSKNTSITVSDASISTQKAYSAGVVAANSGNITVSNSTITTQNSQGAVINAGNSMTLTDTDITANNATLGRQAKTKQAVLIYNSGNSSSSSSGSSNFKMTNGSITNTTGDIFCITNTKTTIDLTNVDIENKDLSGNFLRAEAQKWGSSGSDGGHVTLTASSQDIEGDIFVDDDSSLVFTLADKSIYSGAINPSSVSTSSLYESDYDGDVTVIVKNASKLILDGGSAIENLIVESGGKVVLNGNVEVDTLTTSNASDIDYGTYTLEVDNVKYSASNKAPTGTIGDSDDDHDGTVPKRHSSSGCDSGISILSLALLLAALKFKERH